MTEALQYPLIASRVFDTPLLIEQTKANAILQFFAQREGFLLPEGVAEQVSVSPLLSAARPPVAHAKQLTGRSERTDEGYWLIGRIAVIPIIGTLVQRGSYVNSSGLTSYAAISRMLSAALADSRVDFILLEVDSPGGEVAGAFDCAEEIFAARGDKPIFSCASELAASAGYLLASAAGEMAVARTGYTGSVGVVTAHMDYSQALGKAGVAITFVYAGDKKIDGNRYQPLKESAREDKQAEIDTLYALFCDTVARFRDVSVDAVRATEAGVFLGRAGVNAGLADRVNSFSNELSNLAIRASAAPSRLITIAKEVSMTGDNDDKATGQAPSAEAQTRARADGHSEGLKAGADAERERIKAILTADAAEGRTEMAQHLAFSTPMQAPEAVALLETSPKAAASTQSPLSTAMDAVGGTGVRPDADGDEGTQAAAIAKDLDATAIYGRLNSALQPAESTRH